MPKTTTKQTATQADKPWMTDELKSLLADKNRLNHKFKIKNTVEAWNEYTKVRNMFNSRSRQAKQLYFQEQEVEKYRKFLRKRVQQLREEDGRFPAYDEEKVIGRKYIEEVKGYYCELCKRFFKEKEEGTIEHCMTWAHYQRLKNEKFPKEEKKDEEEEEEKKDDDEEEKKEEGGDDEDVKVEEETETTMEEEEELLKDE